MSSEYVPTDLSAIPKNQTINNAQDLEQEI